MAEIAADGATITDLRVRDVRQRFTKHGKIPGQAGVVLERAIAGQRADAGAATGSADPGQFADLIDVDQDGRPGQAKIHGRYQALATGEKLRLVAVFGLQQERLLQRRCRNIFERGGLHGAGMRRIES